MPKTPDATIVPGRQAREHLRTVTRDLRCQLTDAEIRERGEQLARMRRDYDVMLDGWSVARLAKREILTGNFPLPVAEQLQLWEAA